MTGANARHGFSVNVFLPTGDPEGLKVVEKSNWSGRGLVIPKAGFVVFAGSNEWKTKDGRSLKELQEAEASG